MANPNRPNFYGETSDDDEEEEEQLAAEEEKAPTDLASLLKREKDNEEGSSERSIGEIFGISKSEEDDEPSTFDKIIGRTLEEEADAASTTAKEEPAVVEPESSQASETTEAPEDAQTAPEVEVVEPIEPVSPDQAEFSADSQTSDDEAAEDELTAADAISTAPLYADTHEQPLADLSSAESESLPSASDSTEEPPNYSDKERGRADKISGEAAPAEPDEAVPADQPDRQTAERETPPETISETEPEAAVEPEPQLKPETAPKTAQEIASNEKAEDSYNSPRAPEPEPDPEVEAEPAKSASFAEGSAETAEETDHRVKQFMGEGEGSEDEQPPISAKPAAAESEPKPEENSIENLPEQKKVESPAGVLALLVGAREIFKRRKGDKQSRREAIKGDKQNREALEEHESLEEQAKRELKARQTQAESDIDQLKQAQDNPVNAEQASLAGAEEPTESQAAAAAPETVETSESIAANQEPDPVDSPERTVENIYENLDIDQDQLDIEPSTDNGEVREYETIRSLSGEGEAFSQQADYGADDEVEKKAGQKLETDYLSGVEQSTVFNNQEIDGELALDSRQENLAGNKVSNNLSGNLETSHQQPAHISEVIAGSEHSKALKSRQADDLPWTNDKRTPILKNQQVRDSIKAGATIGLIIAALAGIFFIFR